MKEKFTSRAELQDEVELRLVLEGICQLNNKGMLDVLLNKTHVITDVTYQYRSLRDSMLHLILFN